MFKVFQIHRVNWWGIFFAWNSAYVIRMPFWNFVLNIVNEVLSLVEKFKLIFSICFLKLKAIIP